jgi:DMSO reductase anchor subunit
LGTKTKTSFFEGPHTGKNFLTSEMINQIAKSKSFLLRISLCIFVYVTPTYFILQEPYLVMSRNNITTTLIILSIIASIGMFIERYLFFIEAKHTVSLFYGNKII